MSLTREQLQKLFKFMLDEKIEISDLLSLADNNSSIPLVNQSSETEMIDMSDILFVQQHKHNIFEVGTAKGTYTYNKRDIDIMSAVQGYGDFKYLEKNLLVNMSEIKCYDSYMELVYFSDYHKSKDAPKVRIKGVTMKHIKRILGTGKDVTEDHEPKTFSCCQSSKLTT